MFISKISNKFSSLIDNKKLDLFNIKIPVDIINVPKIGCIKFLIYITSLTPIFCCVIIIHAPQTIIYVVNQGTQIAFKRY